MYNQSKIKAITTVFNEKSWDLYKFSVVPDGYWKDEKNHRNFIENLGKHLEIQSLEDWYKITSKSIIDFGGKSLLKFYNDSPIKLITTLFPNHNWLPWKFSQVPKGFWSQIENQKQFIDWLAKELKIEKFEDWYKIQTNVSFFGRGYFMGMTTQ